MALPELVRSIGLFIFAGLCEIGGGYLVWLWLRDRRSAAFGVLGGLILFLYGVLPTFRPRTSGECTQPMVAFLSSSHSSGAGASTGNARIAPT